MEKIVLKPCSENWDKMTPTDQGRHCAKCDMTVHQVDTMSNVEVMQNWHLHNGEFCINIPKERALADYSKWYLNWKYTATTVLFTVWLSAKQMVAKAQEVAVNYANNSKDSKISKCHIKGVVIDSIQNSTPVAFALIRVKLPDGIIKKSYTDALGKFNITITQEYNNTDTITLYCDMVGYESVFINTIIKDTVDAEVFMSQNHICLKEAVILVKKSTMMMRGTITHKHYSGIPVNTRNEIYKKELFDNYDTKTFYSDDIERMNLGR